MERKSRSLSLNFIPRRTKQHHHNCGDILLKCWKGSKRPIARGPNSLTQPEIRSVWKGRVGALRWVGTGTPRFHLPACWEYLAFSVPSSSIPRTAQALLLCSWVLLAPHCCPLPGNLLGSLLPHPPGVFCPPPHLDDLFRPPPTLPPSSAKPSSTGTFPPQNPFTPKCPPPSGPARALSCR